MKSIKMLGFTALTALMAMALLGASPAMAEYTTLCSVDEGEGAHEVCPANRQFFNVHEATLAGTPAILLAGTIGNILCNELFAGEARLNANNEPITLARPLIFLGHFTYSSCVRDKPGGGTENCTVTETSAEAKAELLKEGAELAKVTGAWKVNFHCGIFINCTYDAENLEGTALGALLNPYEENGGLIFNESVLHKLAGGICPTEAKLDLTTQWLVKVWIEE
jgi:hypothetical protein